MSSPARQLQVHADESSEDWANPPKVEEKLGDVPGMMRPMPWPSFTSSVNYGMNLDVRFVWKPPWSLQWYTRASITLHELLTWLGYELIEELAQQKCGDNCGSLLLKKYELAIIEGGLDGHGAASIISHVLDSFDDLLQSSVPVWWSGIHNFRGFCWKFYCRKLVQPWDPGNLFYQGCIRVISHPARFIFISSGTHNPEEPFNEMFNQETDEESAVVPEPTEQLLMVLSSSAWSGTETATTLRLQGQIQHQNILVLIASGSSHTFLSDRLRSELFGVQPLVTPITVKVAGGQMITCCHHLSGCHFSMVLAYLAELHGMGELKQGVDQTYIPHSRSMLFCYYEDDEHHIDLPFLPCLVGKDKIQFPVGLIQTPRSSILKKGYLVTVIVHDGWMITRPQDVWYEISDGDRIRGTALNFCSENLSYGVGIFSEQTQHSFLSVRRKVCCLSGITIRSGNRLIAKHKFGHDCCCYNWSWLPLRLLVDLHSSQFFSFSWDPGDQVNSSLGTSHISRREECQVSAPLLKGLLAHKRSTFQQQLPRMAKEKHR